MTISTAAFELGQLYPLVQDDSQRRHLEQIHALLREGLQHVGPANLSTDGLMDLWSRAGGQVIKVDGEPMATMPVEMLTGLLRQLATNTVRYERLRNDNSLRDEAAWSAIHAGGTEMDQVVDSNLGAKDWVARKAAYNERSRYD